MQVYKNEVADKTKEFQHEKAELQKVIEEQKEQIKKGGGAMPPDVEKLDTDLQKAKKEVQEAAVERERFQAQLEMLVQELEQKQVRRMWYHKTWRQTVSPSFPLFFSFLHPGLFGVVVLYDT